MSEIMLFNFQNENIRYNCSVGQLTEAVTSGSSCIIFARCFEELNILLCCSVITVLIFMLYVSIRIDIGGKVLTNHLKEVISYRLSCFLFLRVTCFLCFFTATLKPSHRVCKPAYLVPVPNQDKSGGLCQEGHLA